MHLLRGEYEVRHRGMRLGLEPNAKRYCSHSRRVRDLLEAGRCGERRPTLTRAHSVTRGADIKRELTALLNIAALLRLNCCGRNEGAECGRDGQYSHHANYRFGASLEPWYQNATNQNFRNLSCALWGGFQ